jgi:hypothetical protein
MMRFVVRIIDSVFTMAIVLVIALGVWIWLKWFA